MGKISNIEIIVVDKIVRIENCINRTKLKIHLVDGSNAWVGFDSDEEMYDFIYNFKNHFDVIQQKYITIVNGKYSA